MAPHSGQEGNWKRDRMMDYEGIEGKANELTKVYSEPPIPVYRIARNLGVQVWVTDFGDIAEEHSGFCDFREREIYLNRRGDTKMRLLAAAHELGHLLFHVEHFREKGERFAFSPIYPGVAGDSEPENEANLFARCLLLPRAILELHLNKGTEPSILAAAFDVTVDTLQRREIEITSLRE